MSNGEQLEVSEAERRSAPLVKQKRLGDVLIDKGLITLDQLKIALTEQKTNNIPIGKMLAALGFVTESVIRDVLGETLGHESVDLSQIVPDPEALALVTKDLAIQLQLIPLLYFKDTEELTVAMTDTMDLVALDRLRAVVGVNVEIKANLAVESEIQSAIDKFYGYELSVDGILNELETGVIDLKSLQTGDTEYSQPIVRLMNAILADAVKSGASDIHIEPEEGFIRVRYRIDGVLRQIRSLHRKFLSAIVVRIKVMADMNIADTRIAQDGRISLGISGRSIDFRVSSQPTTWGENLVLRVLDRQKGIVEMKNMGLRDDMLMRLQIMMSRPEGILLVTGPTGSGKTTTLYSMITEINSPDINIMTLEDPVEYPLPMIRQTSVNEAAKLDFATGIRSMMRQDPDVILIGEIRDQDTAEMAMRAAMTGHKVFSTLHTNSAIGIFPRLMDIGISAEILAGNIIGVVSQRLVRQLCDQCKKAKTVDATERQLLGFAAEIETIYEAEGCSSCNYIGYKGRFALMEVLRMDVDLDEMIVNKKSMNEFRQAAIDKGFVSIQDDAARWVADGRTSIDEVTRVIDFTGRLI
ncbi:MAG: GspE/PulE family protein [Gammaproteobacteria bacterium]|nr:GspE/PulE family protein [Gammaproteobacteria bacterium]